MNNFRSSVNKVSRKSKTTRKIIDINTEQGGSQDENPVEHLQNFSQPETIPFTTKNYYLMVMSEETNNLH